MSKIIKSLKLSIKLSSDKKISIALMAPFVILTVQYFILIFFELLETSNASMVQLISKLLVGLMFIYAFPSVFRQNKIKFFVIYFISLLLFLINYLIFFENKPYLDSLIFPLFFMCLPAFLYSMCLTDLSVLKKTMRTASYIVFLFGIILGGLTFSGNTSIGIYSMSLSYYMLLPVIIFLDEFLEKYSIKSFLIILLSIIVILALGSRGAILCVLIFGLLKMVRFNREITYSKVIFSLIPITTIIILLININNILVFAYEFLLKFGIKSRTLLLLFSDEVYLSGREYIYQDITKAIIENPILGIGIGGDRRVLEGEFVYVHNLFFELLANFGVLFGSFISLMLILILIKSLFVKNKEKYNIIIIWISLGFIHLMVSSSYLIDMKFWIFLGLALNLAILKNQKYKYV